MEVERLQAVLEATGLGTFQAQMQAADRATGGTKDQLRALAEISKVATEALKHVKVTAAQAAESDVSAQSILRGVKGIGEEAREAARHLDGVKLSQAQATETRIAADEEVRSLKKVEDQALKTRAATGGGGRGGGIGLLGAAIGGGALLGPAAGPGALGLLAGIPVLASTGAGALGTLFLAFDGVTKAIGGNKKAFDELGPSAQSFVQTVRSLDGWFDKLKETAGAALFPGLTAGLKAALSPGTVNAITQAITSFGHALGEAGAQWGRYFGSAQFQQIFGPLMRAGAQNLGKLSDAAMHLFDAVGMLGRAAIPLVQWMVQGIDSASRWADAFTRSKDATGGLSHAMDQAKQSLQLVGGLFAALAKTVYDLGAALYPVSKVAVKDLTEGLTALDGWLQRNKKTISDIAGGALKDFVAGIKLVVQAVGAWYDAMKKDLGSSGAKAVVIALGAAIAIALGPTSVAIVAAIVAVGYIKTHWATLRDFFKTLGQWIINAFDDVWTRLQRGALKAALAMVEPFSHLPSFLGGWARKAKDNMQAELDKLHAPNMDWSTAAQMAGVTTGQAWVQGLASASGSKYQKKNGGTGVSPADSGTMLPGQASPMDVRGKSLKGENPMIVKALEALAKKGYDVNVTSGYRTYQQQAALYARYVNSGFNIKYIAAKPGTSNHETGNAVDVYVNGKPVDQSRAALAILKKYGLVADVPGDHEHLDLTGYTDTSSPFGTPPPFTSGLGRHHKPPRPPIIPASVTHLLALAGTNASNASALGNTGGTAKRFLDYELMDLEAAHKQLEAALAKAKPGSKAATALDKAAHSVEDKIIKVQELVKNAIIVIGDALLPEKLRAKLKKATAQFTADSDYATVLTGQAADDYRKVLQKDLLSQAAVLQAEEKSLKSRLATATGKQKTAIQTELASVTSSLDQVQQSILGVLQQNVQSLQSKLGTVFGNVTQQFDDALAKMYFQNGAKTALEQQLADMQAQDSLNSLNDSLQAAKDQLAQDQQGGLAAVQFDAATGITKNIYNPAAAKQLSADQKAIEAAQRQLDEYNLGIRAAAERTKMDETYTEKVTTLNKKLADLADAFQNGTGSMQSLRDLADQYGIVISTQNIPDFANLSGAASDLRLALQSLSDYIYKITGVTPKLPAGTNAANTANSSALGAAQAAAAKNPTADTLAAVFQAAHDAGYTQSNGYLGRALGLPGYASGGIVRARPGGTIVRVGEGGQDEEIGPVRGRGGGDTFVTLHVSALDPASVEWGPIAQKVRAELIRTQRRNGDTTGIK